MMNCDGQPMAMRINGLSAFAGLLAASLVLPAAQTSADEPQRPVSFERDVQSIIAENCADCHGARPRKAALDLRTIDSILRGGKSGPVLSSSDPDASLLLERIRGVRCHQGRPRKLSADEVTLIRAWVRAGEERPSRRGEPADRIAGTRRRPAVLVVSPAQVAASSAR